MTGAKRRDDAAAQSGPERGGRRRVRLQDVAKAAGVSSPQASRALTGAGRVSAETRDRIRQLARELGYRASARARSLRTARDAPLRTAVALLGMTSDQLARSAIYGPLLAGLLGRSAEDQIDVHLVPLPLAGDDPALAPQLGAAALRRLIAEDRADGVVLLTFVPISPETVAPLDEAGVPYVLGNRFFEDHPAPFVAVDYASAMEDAVDRLAALGHRRMSLLVRGRESSAVRERLKGWDAGLRRHGFDVIPDSIVRYDGEDARAGQRAAIALLGAQPDTGRPRPTALVCHTDRTAHGVLRAAAQLGMRVPEDLSVIGFDNVIAEYTSPALCTYECHPHDAGALLATVLGAALHGKPDQPHQLFLPAEFVCRATCGPPPQ